MAIGLSAIGQDFLLDGSQSPDLLAHLHLGVAVQGQHGFGQVAQEVVLAVAVRYVGELGRDAAEEGVLLVRHPQLDGLAQLLGPFLGLADQTPHLVGRTGEHGLGEPDTLAA